jgi:hypothetical protein
MELVASLLAAKQNDAAARIAHLAASLDNERAERAKYEFEARWLLGHAQELPCRAQVVAGDREDREVVLHSATPADPNLEPCDYVRRDCPRLRALLAGRFSAT